VHLFLRCAATEQGQCQVSPRCCAHPPALLCLVLQVPNGGWFPLVLSAVLLLPCTPVSALKALYPPLEKKKKTLNKKIQ